ncbi:MAG: HD domain-containing protein [Bacillota bacterium]|nr:HD domain-containing protein [Bacillota bacterium]
MDFDNMERLQRIYEHPVYARELKKLEADEQERRFCRHGMNHIMDVARICCIYCMRDGIIDNENLSPELIYATAMLHDIGRHSENCDGIPHEDAGASIAEAVMRDCGFKKEEIIWAINGIKDHRRSEASNEVDVMNRFADNLRLADKKSRPCYRCDVRDECKWHSDKMNLKVGI